MTPRLLLCTGNPHKAEELRALLGGTGDVATLADIGVALDVDEDAPDFEGNALKKARRGRELTGLATVADDSGLCVDALGGRPGVRSARFAQDHGAGEGSAANNALMQRLLFGVPDGQRAARFVCVVALADAQGGEAVFRGELAGRMAREPRGSHGFGYDPLFDIDDGRALAMLPAEEKNRLSHRARAMAAALPAIRRALGLGG